jgi:hypothetical protein
MKAGLSKLVDCRPPADLNIYVVEGVAKLGRKLFQRPLDDALELASFHLSTLYQRDKWDTRDARGKRRSETNPEGLELEWGEEALADAEIPFVSSRAQPRPLRAGSRHTTDPSLGSGPSSSLPRELGMTAALLRAG